MIIWCTFEIPLAPMLSLITYESEYLNKGKITPEELFMNTYAEEIYEL